MTDPFDRLRPTRPPAELRARVLAAAREAAHSPAPGFLDLLLADRALRACAVLVAVLAIATAVVDGHPSLEDRPQPRTPIDEGAAAEEIGRTAAEQIPDLASEGVL